MAKASGKDRKRMVCAACSSEQVTREARAEWNVAAQAWQMSVLLDAAFCQRCRMATHVEERPLA